jgi:hypothetical protein
MLSAAKCLILAVLACGLAAVEVPAEVVSVTDGDTIVVTVAGTEERVRLLYLDTPESRGNSHGAATPEGKLASEFMDLQAGYGLPDGLDPIELGIFSSRLTAICEEMGVRLRNAAFSTNIRSPEA